jgi:hypothetical protein
MANDRNAVGRMSRRNLDRTRRVVEAVEASSFLGGRAAYAEPPVQFVERAKVTTAIPTGTWSAPSSAGRVQLYRFNGSAWVTFGDPVKVLNDFTMSASLPVDRVCKVARIAGEWWLVSASCS